MFDFLKRRRREALRAHPFPDAWREVLDRDVAYVAKLHEADRAELEGLVQIFLAEKNLEGCGGLELTDEIRVTIAAQACLLLLHRETDIYPDLDTVLVYPHAYHAKGTQHDGPVVIESDDARLGESWTRGVVVLAWDHVASSARHLGGDNVVLHEFAHQLDAEDGEHGRRARPRLARALQRPGRACSARSSPSSRAGSTRAARATSTHTARRARPSSSPW